MTIGTRFRLEFHYVLSKVMLKEGSSFCGIILWLRPACIESLFLLDP